MTNSYMLGINFPLSEFDNKMNSNATMFDVREKMESV